MAKTLFARGSDGLVSIHEAGADYENPLSNLGAFYFNSQLDYITVVKIVAGTLSLPQRLPDNRLDVMYNLGAHGFPFAPMLLGVRTDTGQAFCGETIIFANGYGSVRSITAGTDGTYTYLRETCLNPPASPQIPDGVTMPAIDMTYKLFLLSNPGL